jgi:hypothetical protein
MILDSSIARRVRGSRRLRPIGIGAYRLYARLVPAPPGPMIFVNSLPKAGTHLAMSLMDAVPDIRFSGLHVVFSELDTHGAAAERRTAAFRKEVRKLRPSQYMTGHVVHRPELAEELRFRGVRTVHVIRDPRAVVVSAAMYLRSNSRLALHPTVMRRYADDNALFTAVITGFEADPDGPAAGRGYVGLRERLDSFLGWTTEPDNLLLRYEDLIGPRGGGDPRVQYDAITGALAFLGLSSRVADPEGLADQVFSTKSATFRSGQIDGWKAHLTEEHRALIAETCGQQLAQLGYEP